MKMEYIDPNVIKLSEERRNEVTDQDLIRLAFGIGWVGVFPPVVVCEECGDVIMGEKRLFLAQILGWNPIPAIYAREEMSEDLMVYCGDADLAMSTLVSEFETKGEIEKLRSSIVMAEGVKAQCDELQTSEQQEEK